MPGDCASLSAQELSCSALIHSNPCASSETKLVVDFVQVNHYRDLLGSLSRHTVLRSFWVLAIAHRRLVPRTSWVRAMPHCSTHVPSHTVLTTPVPAISCLCVCHLRTTCHGNIPLICHHSKPASSNTVSSTEASPIGTEKLKPTC